MTRRGEATRARLIEATRTVVREAGYAHASTRAIAKAAGVAEGTIYRHFPDKASLFLATVMESNAPVIAWVTALPDRAGESTVEQNLIDVAVRLAGLRDDVLPLELAIAADPELAAQRRRVMAAAGPSLPPGPPEAVAAYLAAEQRLGRVREDVDPREAASLLLGMLFALGTMPVVGDDVPVPDRVASAVRLLVRGVGPAGPDPRA
ncbi:MAG TPA: TetR family transcriptional regulator [Candidatus Limnocylindrales bacterium]|nr:TetR family transcriptional regulator [Candidatus Limnocylindrales bacterium]